MRIIFLSKKKEEKHMRTIEKFTHMALENYDFELCEDGTELMGDIFGLKGLFFGKAMCEKRLEEIREKIIKGEGSEVGTSKSLPEGSKE